MAGITETKELAGFLCSLGNAIGKSVDDGDFGFTDVIHFVDALKKAFAALSNLGEIATEMVDLSGDERRELQEYIIKEFDIPQDTAEIIVESGLDIALDLFALIQENFLGGDDK